MKDAMDELVQRYSRQGHPSAEGCPWREYLWTSSSIASFMAYSSIAPALHATGSARRFRWARRGATRPANPRGTSSSTITCTISARRWASACVEVFNESGRKIPKPNIEAAQWRQRLPRTLYSKLTKQAENEGVSINSLVTAIIAEAIGAKQAR